MQNFIYGLYPGRIDLIMKTGDGITVNKLWDVERYPCLGCHYFHNRYHNVEIFAEVDKEIHTNREALG
jgi:hypothetical protein